MHGKDKEIFQQVMKDFCALHADACLREGIDLRSPKANKIRTKALDLIRSRGIQIVTSPSSQAQGTTSKPPSSKAADVLASPAGRGEKGNSSLQSDFEYDATGTSCDVFKTLCPELNLEEMDIVRQMNQRYYIPFTVLMEPSLTRS